MGKSLTFRGAVYEAQDIIRNHRCHDPICDTHLWKVRHELDMARIRIRQLEKELESHGIKPSRRSVTDHPSKHFIFHLLSIVNNNCIQIGLKPCLWKYNVQLFKKK